MMLVDVTTIPTQDLPIADFRNHLRLGTGFADDTLQDSVLEQSLRAAISAIEARTGKVLLQRMFRWTVRGWRCPEVQALPVAPVVLVDELKVISRSGDETLIADETYILVQDFQRPSVHAVGTALPSIPTLGTAEFTMLAGFSADWAGLPADLAQSTLLLAAHYYETRDMQPAGDGNMPFGVSALIERYRTVRILGGAVA